MPLTASAADAAWFAPRRPVAYVGSMALAGFTALSIHVLLLYAGVPFPLSEPPPSVRHLNGASGTAAVFLFVVLARRPLRQMPAGRRVFVIFAAVTMLQETMRGAVMQSVVTGGSAFGLIATIGPYLRALTIAILCVVGAFLARSRVSLALVGLGTVSAMLAIQPFISAISQVLISHFVHLQQPDRYTFPYPIEVLAPAYLTFAEAVIGAGMVIALVWKSLPQGTWAKILACTLLIPLLKGILTTTFLFTPFMRVPVSAGLLHYSQFLLQFMALGGLSAAAWHHFGPAENAPIDA